MEMYAPFLTPLEEILTLTRCACSPPAHNHNSQLTPTRPPLPPAYDPQILFVSGLTLIIGPHKTFYFFARRQKLRGTVCFLGGILLVFCKWPFVGMVVETFGFLNLFGYVCPL